MNLEEMAALWDAACKATTREHALNELAKTEPRPTVPYLSKAGAYHLSPLGLALLQHPEGDAATQTFLERGASPHHVAEKLVWRDVRII